MASPVSKQASPAGTLSVNRTLMRQENFIQNLRMSSAKYSNLPQANCSLQDSGFYGDTFYILTTKPNSSIPISSLKNTHLHKKEHIRVNTNKASRTSNNYSEDLKIPLKILI